MGDWLLDELQLRALSGMYVYPELLGVAPAYLTGVEPWLTIRRALDAYHGGRVGGHELLMGVLNKYGEDYFTELVRVLENTRAVSSRGWAQTQIDTLGEYISRKHGENKHAA